MLVISKFSCLVCVGVSIKVCPFLNVTDQGQGDVVVGHFFREVSLNKIITNIL